MQPPIIERKSSETVTDTFSELVAVVGLSFCLSLALASSLYGSDSCAIVDAGFKKSEVLCVSDKTTVSDEIDGVIPNFTMTVNRCLSLRTGDLCIQPATVLTDEKSLSIVRKYFSKKCAQKEYVHCSLMGQLEEAQKKDRDAETYFRLACGQGVGAACTMQATLLERESKKNDATAVFIEACEKKDTLACAFVGLRLYLGLGKNAKPTPKIMDFVRRVCPPPGGGCGGIGEAARKANLASQALLFYKAGCENGEKYSCSMAPKE